MESLVKKINSLTTAILVLVLVVLGIVSIALFRLNLSPDFSSSRVVILELDQEVDLNEVKAAADNILKTSQILKENSERYYIHFQNVSDSEIENFRNSIASVLPGVSSTSDYNFRYTGEILIAERLLILAVVVLVIYLAFVAWGLKGLGLNRLQLSKYLIAELIIIAFSVVVLSGLGSLLGGLGILMDLNYWSLYLLALAVIISTRLYTLMRFKDYAGKTKDPDLGESYRNMYSKYWPEFVFISCLALVIAVLPWVVLGQSFLFSSSLVLLAVFLGAFNFMLLQRHFLDFLSDLQLKPVVKNGVKSFWKKPW